MNEDRKRTGDTRLQGGEPLLAGWMSAAVMLVFARIPPLGRLAAGMANGNGALGPALQGFSSTAGHYVASLVAYCAALLLMRASAMRRDKGLRNEITSRP